jgi:hypothetical protein
MKEVKLARPEVLRWLIHAMKVLPLFHGSLVGQHFSIVMSKIHV